MERSTILRTTTATGLAILGLGLSACGQSSSEEAPSPTKSETTAKLVYTLSEGKQSGVKITEEFYPKDGTRAILYKGDGAYFQEIYSFCDGIDLVDETFSSTGASSIERSVGHVACSDGKLTPADFQLPPKPE